MDSQYQYIILLLIPLGTIWGNIFVCLAVYLERRLRHRFNLFLVSLAISDLLCATIVMPMSVLKMITGNETKISIDPLPWYEKKEVCLTWYSLDIFFTATTIIHLCTISLDRYLALRSPLTRSNQLLPKCLGKLALRIFMCWFVPFAIAGPLFAFQLMHKENTVTAHTPDTHTSSYKGCGPNEVSFVFTAIGVTFVLPLIIMIVTYILTVRSLLHHLRQAKTLNLYANTRLQIISHTSNYPLKKHFDSFMRSGKTFEQSSHSSYLQRSVSMRTPHKTPPVNYQPVVIEEAMRKQSHGTDVKTGQCSAEENGNKHETKWDVGGSDQVSVSSETSTDEHSEKPTTQYPPTPHRSTQIRRSRTFAPEYEYETCEERIDSVDQRNDNLAQPQQRIMTVSSTTTMDKIHSGKRAVRVIGVLFGLFVTCYLPFFIVYAINAILEDPDHWTGKASAHLEWLGYTSSMLNPVVYHAFNPIFRRTFRRILRCACARTSYSEQPSGLRDSKRL